MSFLETWLYHVEIVFQNISFQILCGMLAISILMLVAFCLLQHYTKQVAEAQGVETVSYTHLTLPTIYSV